MTRLFVASGALLSLIAVISRSLSSHKIRPTLEARGSLDNFNLASDYLLAHGLALLLIAVLVHLFPQAQLGRAGVLLLAGALLFCGSVLIKSLVGLGPLGMITPLGGLCLMAGWLMLGLSALKI